MSHSHLMNRYLVLAALILTATVTRSNGQDDLDSLSTSLKTTPEPTPAAAVSPKSTPTATSATPAPAVTRNVPVPVPAAPSQARSAATPKQSPVDPAHGAKADLAHGQFIVASDLPALAGKKVGANVFLTGTYKATGQHVGSRHEFTDIGGLFGGGKTHLMVRFPVAPDPKILSSGYSSRWEKAAPLRVEKVESNPQGTTAYAVDVTP